MNKKPPPTYGSMASTSDVQFAGTAPTAFSKLCDSIVTNIYTVNSNSKQLETSLRSIGTSRDNRGLRDKIHVTQLSANEIVNETNRDVHRLAVMVRKCEKYERLQAEKLTENFKEAVERYSSLQKKGAEKMKMHLLVSPVEDLAVTEDENVQKQAQLARELAFEEDMLREREIKVRQIESVVLDINDIIRELSALTHQQGEVVDTIENNIDYAVGHIEDGATEVQKAAQYQRKYRRKLFILALIGTILLVILVIILAVELRR